MTKRRDGRTRATANLENLLNAGRMILAHASSPRRLHGLRRQRILTLLRTLKPDGSPYSHSEIARQPEVHCSREYVRQVDLITLGGRGRSRQNQATAIRRQNKVRLPHPYRWVYLVRKWLAGIGHGYCCQCHRCLPMDLLGKPAYSRCKQCVTANARDWYRTAEGKAKRAAWLKANSEKVRKYQRDYGRRHAEEFNARDRAGRQARKRMEETTG